MSFALESENKPKLRVNVSLSNLIVFENLEEVYMSIYL